MSRLADPSEILPALSLGSAVFFPGMKGRVVLANLRALGAVQEATRSRGEKAIAVFARRGRAGDSPSLAKVFQVGSVARVIDFWQLPYCRRWVALIEATHRVRLIERLLDDPFRIARVSPLDEPGEDQTIIDALVAEIRRGAGGIARRAGDRPRVHMAVRRLRETERPLEIPGVALELLDRLPVHEQQRALELPLLSARLAFVVDRIHRRLEHRRQGSCRWN